MHRPDGMKKDRHPRKPCARYALPLFIPSGPMCAVRVGRRVGVMQGTAPHPHQVIRLSERKPPDPGRTAQVRAAPGCPGRRCRAFSDARASPPGRRPSPDRTCPGTCRPTPWRRGAARERSRWSSTTSWSRPSPGLLPARSPRQLGCRMLPSAVHSVNATSPASRGSAQCAPRAYRGGTGVLNGLVSRSSGASCRSRPVSIAAVNPGADVPRVPQPVIVIDTQQQGADRVSAAALALVPPADDDLLVPDVLDLDPVPATARMVAGGQRLARPPPPGHAGGR